MDKSSFLFENRMILLIIFMIPQTVPFVKMEYYTRNTLEFWKTWQFFGGIHAFATDSKKHAGFCRRVCPEPAFFGNIRQYRTKSVWRLCTPSACKFPFRACFVSSRTHLACIFSEIFRENTRKSTKDFLRFSLHLSKKSDDAICIRQIRNRLSYFTKNLTTHLSHNLCAVLP